MATFGAGISISGYIYLTHLRKNVSRAARADLFDNVRFLSKFQTLTYVVFCVYDKITGLDVNKRV